MFRNLRWPIMLGISGLALFGAATWTLVQGFGGWHDTIQGPGPVEVQIPFAGDYRLWHEQKTSIDGRLQVVADNLPSGSSVEVNDLQGNIIPLRPVRGSMTQEVGGTRRVAIGHIEFPYAGTYKLSITGFDEPRQFRLSEIRFLDNLLRALLFAVPGTLLFMSGLIWGILAAARETDSGPERVTRDCE